jgi:hypothetical protein
MKNHLLPVLALFAALVACQPSETSQEAAEAPVAAPAAPRPDVVAVGYTSEETNLLAQPDFGAPTVLTIDPLATVEILDTSNVFFFRVRVPDQGPNAAGYIDRVYLSDDLETANLLYDKRKRRP